MLLNKFQQEIPENLHPTRLAEWIVGRILIQTLCSQFGIDFQGIDAKETGKPFLTGNTAEISISHSFPMAAAIIHKSKPCGIDLERVRQKLVKIQHKFVNSNEEQYLNDPNKLCAIWCGKEVLYKLYGRKKLSMKEETTISFESDEVLTGLIHKDGANAKYRIHYEQVKDYFLAYSL